ncbi:SURF1 family protein [Bailinhaonella thermotolerans]|uniref:SURF1-like protein n=1 Tax=Bailinhaonella thermotolerans TaxID=1070861 RepID=A0A3A4AUV2_9ACTN|nr:SURF1 family protein [Bailinhaonella thermotolerans]RJL32055.1 SURF1 family protein [Bailinhaonella thermotolerans]
MYRFLLSPRWLGLHVVVLLVIPAFILLGKWQYGRFEERSVIAARAERNLAAAAVPLETLNAPGRPVPAELRRRAVTVSGRYDTARELVVRRRTQNSRLGFYVITPLVSGDRTVIVNRGWVPAGATALEAPKVPPAPAGQVTVTGRLQPSETTASTGIKDRGGTPAGQVLLIDVPALAKSLPGQVYGGYVELTKQEPAGAPAPEPVPPPDVGGGGGLNLAYAVQWWVFAVIAVGGWFFLVRREARDRASGPDSSATAGPAEPGEAPPHPA